MFDNVEGVLSALPVELQGFYHEEVRQEHSGEMVEESYQWEDENGDTHTGIHLVPELLDITYTVANPRGETQRNVSNMMRMGKSVELVGKFLAFENNAIDWEYHDSFIEWLNSEPEHYEQIDDGEGVLVPELPFEEVEEQWFQSKPERGEHLKLTDYAEYRHWSQMIGVEFDGVMCSATKEDFWGLSAAVDWVKAGNSTVWNFSNGSKLKLTAENADAFYSVWLPFRLSFFSEGE